MDSPGDYLRAEDDEVEGFKTRLNERLAPVGSQFSGEGVNEDWEIGDTLAQWWRPNFETFMYPFIPAHVTRPKECKKLYYIQLPRHSMSFLPFATMPYPVHHRCNDSISLQAILLMTFLVPQKSSAFPRT